MRTFIFTAHDGKPDFGSELNVSLFRQGLKENEGKRFKIVQEKLKRTLSQNNYLWGVVYFEISQHTGHSEEELHEIYKRLFLPPQFVKYKGTEIKVAGSTAKLNKLEMGEYIDRVISEAGSMGIHIPTPEEGGFYK